MKEIIKITQNEEGNIVFEQNLDFPTYAILGALDMVKSVIKAKMIEEVLSGKDTDKTKSDDDQLNK